MQETPVQFLGQEDPLDKGQATYSSMKGECSLDYKLLEVNQTLFGTLLCLTGSM